YSPWSGEQRGCRSVFWRRTDRESMPRLQKIADVLCTAEREGSTVRRIAACGDAPGERARARPAADRSRSHPAGLACLIAEQLVLARDEVVHGECGTGLGDLTHRVPALDERDFAAPHDEALPVDVGGGVAC